MPWRDALRIWGFKKSRQLRSDHDVEKLKSDHVVGKLTLEHAGRQLSLYHWGIRNWILYRWGMYLDFCRSLPTEILNTTRCTARLWGQIVWSAQKELCLSPRVEETKSEVYKTFVLEQRSSPAFVHDLFSPVFLHMYTSSIQHKYIFYISNGVV